MMVSKTGLVFGCTIILCGLYTVSAKHFGYSNSSKEFVEDITFKRISEYVRNYDKPKDSKCFEDASCPPWFYCDKNSSECKCGPSHDRIVRCNEAPQTLDVLDCYCVTYDEKKNTTVAGACFANCENRKYKDGFDPVYNPLPSNLSDLNEIMCQCHSLLNRTGTLCGECKPGTYPLVYSYNLSCVDCPEGHKNWWKYILVAFLPLTVFYFIVLFFKISATSSHLHGYVFICQSLSNTQMLRFLLRFTSSNSSADLLARVVINWYSIWSLDFFRVLLPNICLHTTTLQTLALDYAIAVYPLLLMIISYVLIELHDRNFRIIVFIWKPFRFVLLYFRRNWDSHTSVIDAYATFFLLSMTKFLCVSFDILTPAHLYALNSNDSSLVVYYDASIEYFGKEHRPYAILAVLVLLVFIVLPLAMLILYPFRLFQKFLSYFPTRWENIVRTFVDSFLGCYKDGTEPGSRDCRWFCSLFILWRIFALIIYAMAVQATALGAAVTSLLLLTMLMVVVQPFKPEVAHYTKINAIFTLLLALFYNAVIAMDVASIKQIRSYEHYLYGIYLLSMLPLLYIPCIALYWLFSHKKWSIKSFVSKLKAWRQGYVWGQLEQNQDFEESFPDRIVNPGNYHEGNLTDFTSAKRQSRDYGTLSNT